MKKWIIRLIYYCIRPVTLPFKTNRLLLLRYDAIGDYILFRNSIASLKESEKYGNYKFTLLANAAIKDLVLYLDKEHFEEFIWTDQSTLQNNPAWDWNSLLLLLKLKLKGFDIAINPIHSRAANVDRFLGQIGAKLLIGSEGDVANMKNDEKRRTHADRAYDMLVEVPDYKVFEFVRNTAFINKLIFPSRKQVEFSIALPDNAGQFSHNGDSHSIVLFPGAGAAYRRWPAEYFAELIDKIRLLSANATFYITGSKNDEYLAEKIIRNVKNTDGIIDLTGKTTLPGLLQLLKCSSLLISNETSAVHMGAALKIPVICISNGNHFGRFNPYPDEVSNTVVTVYPDISFYDQAYFEQYAEEFKLKSDLQINSIKPAEVFRQVENILKNT